MASLGKAYSKMKTSGHMMAKGGECPACNGGRCMYADGGKAESSPIPSTTPSPVPVDSDFAKTFSKGMKGATSGFAKGGMIHESDMEIDRPQNKMEKKWAGESTAGAMLRNSDINHGSLEKAKDEHHKVLGEIKAMKKPKLMADGGPVPAPAPTSDVQEGMRKAFHFAKGGDVKGTDMNGPETKSFMEKGEFSVGHDAEGGEVEDHELLHHCAGELLSAIESKNTKEIVESLKAIIQSLK